MSRRMDVREVMPPEKTLLRSFIMSPMLVNPMTFVAKGDWGVRDSSRSLAEESETMTYGEPSPAESTLFTTYSRFIVWTRW